MSLQSALKSGNYEIVIAILNVLEDKELQDYPEILKANLENETKDGFMPLPDALKSGNTAIVSKLFQVFQKVDSKRILIKNLSCTNRFGYNCLHQAVNTGNIEIVQLLDNIFQYAYPEDHNQEIQKLNKNRYRFLSNDSHIQAYLSSLPSPSPSPSSYLLSYQRFQNSNDYSISERKHYENYQYFSSVRPFSRK